jgi:nucleoside-diphosphate-sugar epimerase
MAEAGGLMRVVVTGAAGLIGCQVVRELLERGHQVQAVDRTEPADGDGVDGAAWSIGDVRDPAFMAAAVRRARAEALVHLAAIPRPSLGTPLDVFAANTQATFVALEAAGDAGIARVAIASSTSAVGTVFPVSPVSPRYVPVDEEHPFIGSDPYALSKQVDEATAATMHRRHGFQVVALRIPNTGAMDVQVERALAVARDPAIYAAELWAYLDIRDGGRAFALAVERHLPGCHVVNVTAPDTNSSEPTASLLARFHPAAAVRRPIDGCGVPFDLRRAADLLAFEAEHRLTLPRG